MQGPQLQRLAPENHHPKRMLALRTLPLHLHQLCKGAGSLVKDRYTLFAYQPIEVRRGTRRHERHQHHFPAISQCAPQLPY